MMRALWSGVSGLRNHQTRMDVIGNNIANVNTVGYKASRVTFQDMLSQTIQGAGSPSGTIGGTNPMQIGMGMAVATVDTIFTDGAPQATGKQTDLAVSGQGFFQLSNDDGITKTYTRDGAFDFDTEGNYVVPNTGYKVMGYQVDALGNATGAAGPIKIDKTALMPGKESTTLTYTGNLIASALASTAAANLTSATLANAAAALAATPTAANVATAVTANASVSAADKLVATTAAGLPGATAASVALAVNTNYTTAMTTTTTTATAATSALAADTAAATAAAVALATATDVLNAVNSDPGASAADKLVASTAEALPGATAASVALAVNTHLLAANTAAANAVTAEASALAADTAAAAAATPTAASVSAAVAAATGVSAADKLIASTAAGLPGATAASVALAIAANLATATTAGSALNSARQANAAAAGAAAMTSPPATAASVLAAVNADPNVSAADKAIAAAAAAITSPAATAKSVAAAMALNLTTATTAANETSTVPTSLKVYASSGSAYNLTGSFVKTGANTWDFTPIGTIVDTDGSTIANVTTTPASTPVTITFNADGSYSTSTTPYTLTITPVVPPAAASGPAAFTIIPDFSTMTQYDSTSTAMASATDGYGAGSLDKLTISSSGMFVGTYTNGVTKNLAQVALFNFNNPGGLEKTGANMYVETNNSGLATKDQTSSVNSGSLEMSNVDLAQQFSDMIVTQRGFQANSKIITTTDTMLEELVNLKR